jgi:hypothetical protein
MVHFIIDRRFVNVLMERFKSGRVAHSFCNDYWTVSQFITSTAVLSPEPDPCSEARPILVKTRMANTTTDVNIDEEVAIKPYKLSKSE